MNHITVGRGAWPIYTPRGVNIFSQDTDSNRNAGTT